MSKETAIFLGGDGRLDLKRCFEIGRGMTMIALHPKAEKLMRESHEMLNDFLQKRMPIYGSNVHFGSQVNLPDTLLAKSAEKYREAINDRQRGLVESHNCGMGEEVASEIVRVAMALRAHCLALGYSGVRPEVPRQLISFLNEKIHPVIRAYGSVGASGDLIPLSAIAAALCGHDTEVFLKNKRLKANEAMKTAKIKKLNLEIREGLALANGTSFMTAVASLAAYDLQRIFNWMLAAVAMSLESLMVIGDAYDPLVHNLKNQSGEKEVADFISGFWKETRLIKNLDNLRKDVVNTIKKDNGVETIPGLQDYYSLRSVAQGFGPFKENLSKAIDWIEGEINSVNDNPVVSVKNRKVYHCANFMGYYVTEACDILKMDISQASSWLHAILANLVHPGKNSGLPANLVEHPGTYNGFRPIQILAASIAVHNRKLAQSQQAFMLPTEGDNQDVNSLGTHAAFDLRKSVANLEYLISILLLASTQALELRGLHLASTNSRKIHKQIRAISPFVNTDRSLSSDIERVVASLKGGKIEI